MHRLVPTDLADVVWRLGQLKLEIDNGLTGFGDLRDALLRQLFDRAALWVELADPIPSQDVKTDPQTREGRSVSQSRFLAIVFPETERPTPLPDEILPTSQEDDE